MGKLTKKGVEELNKFNGEKYKSLTLKEADRIYKAAQKASEQIKSIMVKFVKEEMKNGDHNYNPFDDASFSKIHVGYYLVRIDSVDSN